MKLHYAGKYSGNPEDLPHREPEPGAVKFKEVEDVKTLGKIANLISIVLLVVTLGLLALRSGHFHFSGIAIILSLLSLLPHELLHASCFKEDVYLYQDLRHGLLFVTGTERWSKGRFIFKSLLPSIVLGFIPFIIFMIHPEFELLGEFGALGIASAAGDFYNVYNAWTQVPEGGMVYMDREHTYWYMPEEKN